jgi:hypothetical protein
VIAGKEGYAFDQTVGAKRILRFRIADAATRTAIDDGYFVGRLRIDYLDRGTNWIYAGTDNAGLDVYNGAFPKDLAEFLAKGSSEWHEVEMDLVNVDFHQGLAGSSDLEFRERTWNGSTHQSGLHSVRILGTVYKKP